jgi:hypothetical protein
MPYINGMNYRHFIITRFNLKPSDNSWNKDRLGNLVLTQEWLIHRVDLFLKYCLPSVINQTNKDFLWLLYFDVSTEDRIIKQFCELEQIHKNRIKILLADGYDGFSDRYRDDILGFCGGDCKYIITTRLDNDDIVHRDFTARIRENFSEQEFIAVNFVKIMMFNPEIANKIYIDYSFSNHFISIIEKIGSSGIIGCYSRGDRAWTEKIKIIQITDRPYCLEIISDRNLLNRFRGFPVFRTVDLSDFSLAGHRIRSSFSDPDNYKFYKMSWRKYLLYLKIKLT